MFCSREFVVSPAVFIARVETEEIINLVLSNSGRVQNLPTIGDVGTGSGCIGITLAELLPAATVYLSDISDLALAIARKNIQTKNIIVLNSNLLTSYPTHLLFDVIVANLPYIPSKRIPRLLAAVRKYEPVLALDGGPDGTLLINRLLNQLPAHLKPGGLAILEIDDTHTLKKFHIPNSMTAEIKKDQFGRNRFLLIRSV